MFSFKSLVLLTASLLPLGISGSPLISSRHPSQTYAKCQRKTSNPLAGCPPKTIYVSQNDTRASFKSIQRAISSIPDNTEPYFILIAPGIYTEQLNVTRRGSLTLLGMSDRPSRRQPYSDIGTDSSNQNEVQVYWNSANHNALFPDNAYTQTLTVAPNLNATLTGAGPTGFAVPADTPFGCTDFRAYNIDFRNEFVPYSYGPALAVGVSYANAGFYSCGFYSWQDTVYVGKLGNAYFYDNIIAGQTDFLYGFGTGWIEQSTLSLRSCGGGITAWKGTNTTFPNKYGIYIANSQLIAANASIAAEIAGKCALGRPWNAQHRSIFMHSYFDASISPHGYVQWGSADQRINNYTFMATYNAYGPGYNVTAERESNITLVLDAKGVAPYRKPVDVFMTPEGRQPDVAWIDSSVL